MTVKSSAPYLMGLLGLRFLSSLSRDFSMLRLSSSTFTQHTCFLTLSYDDPQIVLHSTGITKCHLSRVSRVLFDPIDLEGRKSSTQLSAQGEIPEFHAPVNLCTCSIWYVCSGTYTVPGSECDQDMEYPQKAQRPKQNLLVFPTKQATGQPKTSRIKWLAQFRLKIFRKIFQEKRVVPTGRVSVPNSFSHVFFSVSTPPFL